MSFDSYRQVEEERRLFYVAITRAEEHCYLSYAKNRFKYGKMEFANPSRFLCDIDSKYLNWPKEAAMTRTEVGAYLFRKEERDNSSRWKPEKGPSMFDGGEMPQERPHFVKPMSDRKLRRIPVENATENTTSGGDNKWGITVGKTVVHERFGRGEVINVEGSGENCKATIRFVNAGVRQLLLKFARFKEVD